MELRWSSDGERVAARALVRRAGIQHLEAATEERVVELEGRSLDDRRAPAVHQDPNAVRRGDHVVVLLGGVGEGQLVGEAGAPAGDHPDAEHRLGPSLPGGELPDLAGGPIRHRDHRCGLLHATRIPAHPRHERSVRPRKAPFTLSDSVGYAWIASPIADAGTRPAIAATTSWIMAPASSPTMWPPSSSSERASATSFTSPNERPSMADRSLSPSWVIAVRIWWPASRAARSVSPTLATSGSQNVTRGTTR